MAIRHTPEQSRAVILDAARDLVMREGLPAFTLEAVARRAQLSKAGVLHHFPDKEQLAAAMARRELDRFVARVQELAEADRTRRGRYVRAYLHTSVEMLRTDHLCFVRFNELAWSSPAVQAAIRPVCQEWAATWYGEDGRDAVETRILFNAIDGCMLDLALGLATLDDPFTQATLERLEALSRGGRK